MGANPAPMLARPIQAVGLSPANASRPLLLYGLPLGFVLCVSGGACENFDQPPHAVNHLMRAACLETAPNTPRCLIVRPGYF